MFVDALQESAAAFQSVYREESSEQEISDEETEFQAQPQSVSQRTPNKPM
jgi:hypothetical protein